MDESIHGSSMRAIEKKGKRGGLRKLPRACAYDTNSVLNASDASRARESTVHAPNNKQGRAASPSPCRRRRALFFCFARYLLASSDARPPSRGRNASIYTVLVKPIDPYGTTRVSILLRGCVD